MRSPGKADLEALRRLGRYLLDSPRVVYDFQWGSVGDQLVVYADTDFAGCRATRRSTSGGCALWGGKLVKHWSTTQKAITLSSGEAELGGVVKAASEALGLQSVAEDLGVLLKIALCTDSSAAVGICRAPASGACGTSQSGSSGSKSWCAMRSLCSTRSRGSSTRRTC